MSKYIPQLNQASLVEVPLTTEWKGATDHIGPVQKVTKLVDMLSGKTTCATVTLMSGVLLWGAKRLKNFTETDFMTELAEAIYAWQHHWMYVDTKQLPKCGFNRQDHPVGESAALTLSYFSKKNLKEAQWNSFYQPIMDLSHMVNVQRFYSS